MDLALASKKILTIDLDRKTYEVRNHTDLHRYIGGVGLALKLFQMHEDRDPLVFAIGPLNGFYPFASKTAIVLDDGGTVEDLYLGGSLSLRIKFTDIDAIAIVGKLKDPAILNITNTNVEFRSTEEDIFSLGLPGKRSVINLTPQKAFLDHEFTSHEYLLENKLGQKNIKGVVITGTEVAKPAEFDKFEFLYHQILKRTKEMTVEPSNKPSCSNCPMGCEKSRYGEIGGNVFVHSLVACQFAEHIYSDINTTFACLNSIGYTYTHEDLENLPNLVQETLKLIG
jgi:aldehyde:ferredoxin oxidoreductase